MSRLPVQSNTSFFSSGLNIAKSPRRPVVHASENSFGSICSIRIGLARFGSVLFCGCQGCDFSTKTSRLIALRPFRRSQ